MSGSDHSMAPVLSVVTPVFNGARFIEENLDSVAALTVPHEHLVIDGGSTDGTVELLEARDDPALTWVSEADRGQTHAVNKGLERATGSVFAWLNADDAYNPGEVDQAIEMLIGSPDLDAVFGYEDIVDEHGALIKQYRCGPFSWRRYLYLGDYVPTPTIMFKRELLERTQPLDERFVDGADCDFYLRLLRRARVRRVRASLVRFRYHADSKTASNVALQQREVLAIRLEHARTVPERALIKLVNRLKLRMESVRPSWPALPRED